LEKGGESSATGGEWVNAEDSSWAEEKKEQQKPSPKEEAAAPIIKKEME